jgi:hypothetical protein
MGHGLAAGCSATRIAETPRQDAGPDLYHHAASPVTGSPSTVWGSMSIVNASAKSRGPRDVLAGAAFIRLFKGVAHIITVVPQPTSGSVQPGSLVFIPVVVGRTARSSIVAVGNDSTLIASTFRESLGMGTSS